MEVAGGVEGELAEELSGVAVEDPDVEVVDEEGDPGAGVESAESDVVESAVVAQGDGARGVDTVVTDSPVGVDVGAGGGGLGSGGVGRRWCAATDRSVGSNVVVVAAEPVELAVQAGDGACGWLGGEPLLLGLLEAFDLAAGLGVVGAGVVEADTEAAELDLEGDAAAATLSAGEHGAVVGEHAGRGFPTAGRRRRRCARRRGR